MPPAWRRPYGLRPTLRHLMILVVGAAVLSALAAPLRPQMGNGVTFFLLLPLGPPLLATLVLLLDRPGPVKYWLVGLLGSLFLPACFAALDGLALLWVWSRGLPGPGSPPVRGGLIASLVVANLFGLVELARVVRRLPGRCPECGRRAVLPLAGLRWCATCGEKVRRP